MTTRNNDPRFAELADWSAKSHEVRIIMASTLTMYGVTSARMLADIDPAGLDELYADCAQTWGDFGPDDDGFGDEPTVADFTNLGGTP